jgi:solute carrier family 25 carnitine/acylcarnitine transporter 20/29
VTVYCKQNNLFISKVVSTDSKKFLVCCQNLLKQREPVTTVQVSGLYKGISSPLAGVAVVNAIVFGVYGNFQRHLPRPDALSSHFMAGAAAGFVQSFVCCPMELVKSRLQVQQNSVASGCGYSGAKDCFAQVAR